LNASTQRNALPFRCTITLQYLAYDRSVNTQSLFAHRPPSQRIYPSISLLTLLWPPPETSTFICLSPSQEKNEFAIISGRLARSFFYLCNSLPRTHTCWGSHRSADRILGSCLSQACPSLALPQTISSNHSSKKLTRSQNLTNRLEKVHLNIRFFHRNPVTLSTIRITLIIQTRPAPRQSL
jgi:hypothetical protein